MTAMAEECMDLTLIVTASGVLVAAGAFLWTRHMPSCPGEEASWSPC